MFIPWAKRPWFIVFILLFCKEATAQNELTLNQALIEGIENNHELKSAHSVYEVAHWKKREVLGNFLPKIDIVANHFFDLKYQQIQISPTSIFESTYPKTSFGAVASLNLFDGFRTSYNYMGSLKIEEAAELEYEHNKILTENSIRLKYFQALGAQVLASLAETNLKTLTDHLKRAQDLLKQGELTKVDVLKIQVQVEQAIPEKFSALDNVYLARKSLAEVMGYQNDNRLLVEALPSPEEKSLDHFDLNSEIQSMGRLDLLATKKRVEASDIFNKSDRSQWLPRVNLITDYQYYNNRNFSLSQSDKFRNAYSVGINFLWNVFDGGVSYAKYNESFFQKKQLEEKAKKSEMSSVNEAEFWKRRYLNSAVLYAAKLRSVSASKESVRIFQTGLKAGTKTSSDLLDAELDLAHSEAGVVKAQLDAIEAKLNLELAIGRRL